MAASAKTAALSGIDWGNPKNPIILQQIMGAQIRSARDAAERIMGKDHYIAVDPACSSSQEAVLGLDVATDKAKKTLASMAQDAFAQFLKDHPTFVALLKSTRIN
jgi:hypothetical protein